MMSSILCLSLEACAVKFFSSARSFSTSGFGGGRGSPFVREEGFSADAGAGVEVDVAWGVRTALSVESTRRIATVFMASPFLGVERRLRSGGALLAGDLKVGFTGVLFDLATSRESCFGRLGADSEVRGGSASGRFRLAGADFGAATERGVSSSESDVDVESFGRADGLRLVLRGGSGGVYSLIGDGLRLSMRSTVFLLCFLYLSLTTRLRGGSARSGS